MTECTDSPAICDSFDGDDLASPELVDYLTYTYEVDSNRLWRATDDERNNAAWAEVYWDADNPRYYYKADGSVSSSYRDVVTGGGSRDPYYSVQSYDEADRPVQERMMHYDGVTGTGTLTTTENRYDGSGWRIY